MLFSANGPGTWSFHHSALFPNNYASFPDDAAFWWQLHLEERNHASLLRSIKNTFLPINVYPDGLVLPSLQQLKKTNECLQSLLEKFRDEPPARDEAFSIAMEVETSAGEIHFQRFAEQRHENKIDKIFCRLVSEDKDHLERIQRYMLDENPESVTENNIKTK